MDVVVFADVHAHKHSQFSTPDPEFGTNRMRHIILCLRQARDYAIDNSIKHVFIVGDLFHSRGILSVEVYDLILDEIKAMKDMDLNVIIVAGNHDQANKSGSITSIKGLQAYADVIERFFIDDDIAFIPFSESKEEIIEQFAICRSKKVKRVFAHIPVAGGEMVDGYYSSSAYEVSLSDIQPKAFNFVAMGHYHIPQFISNSNVFYLGSLLHHSFADSGQAKGFWHMKLRSGEDQSVFCPTLYPKFIKADLPDKKSLLKFLKEYNGNNFYKVVMSSKLSLPDTIDNVIIEVMQEEFKHKQRLQGIGEGLSSSPMEVVEAYLRYKGISNIQAYAAYANSVFSRLEK